MLNKLNSLNYQFGNDGSVIEVTVGFNDYQGEVQGNLTVRLTPEDGDLDSSTPNQLREIARIKSLLHLEKEEEEYIEGEV